jgi:hypothetical protein
MFRCRGKITDIAVRSECFGQLIYSTFIKTMPKPSRVFRFAIYKLNRRLVIGRPWLRLKPFDNRLGLPGGERPLR